MSNDPSWFLPAYRLDHTKYMTAGYKVQGPALNLLRNTYLSQFETNTHAKSAIIFPQDGTTQIELIELYSDAEPWTMTPHPIPRASYKWNGLNFYPANLGPNKTPEKVDQAARIIESNERLIKALIQVGDTFEKATKDFSVAAGKALPALQKALNAEPPQTPAQELIYYAVLGLWYSMEASEKRLEVPEIERTANTSCVQIMEGVINGTGTIEFIEYEQNGLLLPRLGGL